MIPARHPNKHLHRDFVKDGDAIRHKKVCISRRHPSQKGVYRGAIRHKLVCVEAPSVTKWYVSRRHPSQNGRCRGAIRHKMLCLAVLSATKSYVDTPVTNWWMLAFDPRTD